MVKKGLADHPLGHGGGLGFGAGGRVNHPVVGLPRPLEIGPIGQTAAQEVVDLVLLLELGEIGGDLRRNRIGLAPPVLQSQRLSVTQRNHRHPRLMLSLDR